MYYYISIALSFVFTYKWFQYMYPVELRIIQYQLGWYSLKAYTLGQYALKISKTFFKKYILPLVKEEEDNIIFLTNHDDAEKDMVFKTNYNKLQLSKIPYYDLILYTIDAPTYNEKYMIICNQLIYINNNVEKSNVKLLGQQIKLNGTLIPIVFEENIYLKNNILFDNLFIKWYLFTKKNIKLKDTDDYSIHFIDNNMDFVELQKNKYIILDKDNYTIVSI
jgi:hypothetical protein